VLTSLSLPPPPPPQILDVLHPGRANVPKVSAAKTKTHESLDLGFPRLCSSEDLSGLWGDLSMLREVLVC
jgi:hypothetical protein